MNDMNSGLITDEVLRISARLKNGTLESRLCWKCGNIQHYGMACVPAEPRRAKIIQRGTEK